MPEVPPADMLKLAPPLLGVVEGRGELRPGLGWSNSRQRVATEEGAAAEIRDAGGSDGWLAGSPRKGTSSVGRATSLQGRLNQGEPLFAISHNSPKFLKIADSSDLENQEREGEFLKAPRDFNRRIGELLRCNPRLSPFHPSLLQKKKPPKSPSAPFFIPLFAYSFSFIDSPNRFLNEFRPSLLSVTSYYRHVVSLNNFGRNLVSTSQYACDNHPTILPHVRSSAFVKARLLVHIEGFQSCDAFKMARGFDEAHTIT
ncbi:hypothetical protein VNO77_03064 [Canavalia gladiata]|uniref:Uncharacterized protein n=1 Tax=Canavalia gladiata TaxID=3824 RepID=A0AAN9RBV9_CANGL